MDDMGIIRFNEDLMYKTHPQHTHYYLLLIMSPVISLTSCQKTDKQNNLIASARLSSDVHAAMLKMASLQGYTTISDYVADAIIEKTENVARSIIGAVQTKHSSFKNFDPSTVEF